MTPFRPTAWPMVWTACEPKFASWSAAAPTRSSSPRPAAHPVALATARWTKPTRWTRPRHWSTRPLPWDAAPLCHAVGGTGLPIAIKAGAGSIEHGCYLATDPDMLKMMADQGTFFTPTFEVYDFHSTVSAPHIRVRAQALMDIHIRSTELAIKEGVRIVAGTDAGGFVHGDNARELELMVEKGMSTMMAIQAATGYAAECCGIGKEVGTIRGRQAGGCPGGRRRPVEKYFSAARPRALASHHEGRRGPHQPPARSGVAACIGSLQARPTHAGDARHGEGSSFACSQFR